MVAAPNASESAPASSRVLWERVPCWPKSENRLQRFWLRKVGPEGTRNRSFRARGRICAHFVLIVLIGYTVLLASVLSYQHSLSRVPCLSCLAIRVSLAIMKRALITGGAGFLGQNLARKLASDGVEVVVLDIRRPDASAGFSARVEVVVGDLTDPAVVKKAMDRCDVVFHTASVIDTVSLWAATPKRIAFLKHVNVVGTKVLLSAADASATVRSFVYTSSVNAIAVRVVLCGVQRAGLGGRANTRG